QVWVSFGDLITGKFGFNQLSGPIGVTGAIGDVVNDAIEVAKEHNSWQALLSPLFMIAYITINLGVFNLMPLPALDGGRLIFLLIEAVRGKPVPAKYEGFVHAAGFFLLIGLMIAVTYQDILKIFTR
ncbi:MAG: site-2 protease family protein, partial [Oscillospiraceae bacterium]